MQVTNWKRWAIGGVAAATLATGSLWVVDSASAATPGPATIAPAQAQDMEMVRFGSGFRDRSFGRFDDMAETGQALLAEQLGISVEELQAAQDTAQAKERDAALAQAVTDGTLTQAQADAIKELEGLWGGRDLGRFRMGTDEHDVYLAEALGITVEELQAARDAAVQAGIAQAVTDGKITQEQADLMVAGLALKGYVGDRLQDVYEETVQQAVEDGVITQEQADQLLEGERGFFGRGIPQLDGGMRFPQFDGGRGHNRPGMRGGFPGGMMDDDFRGGMRDGMRGRLWDDSGDPDTQSNNGQYVTPDSLL